MTSLPESGSPSGRRDQLDLQAHTRTFTRITLQNSTRQVGLAVPDDMPMPELVRLGLQELGGSPRDRWQIVHPVSGPIVEPETLATARVRDGEILSLVPDEMVIGDQAVDDVADQVRSEVVRRGLWDAALAREVGDWLLGSWLLLASWFALGGRMGHRAWWVPAAGAALLLLLLTARRVLRTERRSAGLVAGLVLMLLWSAHVAAGLHSLSPDTRAALMLAAGAGGLVLAMLLSPLLRPWLRPVIVALVVGAEMVAVHALIGIGLRGAPALAVLCLVILGLLGATTEVTLGISGLSRLDQELVQGTTVTQRTVFDKLSSARRDLAAQLTILSLALACGASLLATHADRPGRIYGLLLLGLLLLRARSYATPVHVLSIALPALAGIAWTTLRLTSTSPETTGWAIPIGALLLALFSMVAAPTVLASRIRLLLDRMERILLLLVLPALAWVFHLYTIAFNHFH